MNTAVELAVLDRDKQVKAKNRAEDAFARIRLLFRYAEKVMSRFLPDSELSQLNRTGYLKKASPLLFESVKATLEMAEFGEGFFDPTLLDELERAGYNRSFELVQPEHSLANNISKLPPLSGRWQGIKLEAATRTIRLPEGLRIDLGGIGKGLTVDRAARLLNNSGYRDFMVSAGGDMYLSGAFPEGAEGWEVELADPYDYANTIATLQVSDGAVATSTTTRRRWIAGGEARHHLIDPRTGNPANTGLISVTVLATCASQADVMAKVALIMGLERGLEFINKQPGCEAIFITEEKRLVNSKTAVYNQAI
jgi:thiamine biosynthesis lipoprotein